MTDMRGVHFSSPFDQTFVVSSCSAKVKGHKKTFQGMGSVCVCVSGGSGGGGGKIA